MIAQGYWLAPRQTGGRERETQEDPLDSSLFRFTHPWYTVHRMVPTTHFMVNNLT